MARLAATHKRAQTVSGPPQSPTRSLEGSRSQTDPLTPWYNGRAGIIPFRYSPDLVGDACVACMGLSDLVLSRCSRETRSQGGGPRVVCRKVVRACSQPQGMFLHFKTRRSGVGECAHRPGEVEGENPPPAKCARRFCHELLMRSHPFCDRTEFCLLLSHWPPPVPPLCVIYHTGCNWTFLFFDEIPLADIQVILSSFTSALWRPDMICI